MKIDFPYPEVNSIDIPDQNLLGILAPSTLEIEKSEDELIEQAFLNPIGSSPLHEILEWCQDVLVLVDDYTRTTPIQKILSRLIGELERSGIKREGIRFLIASGTHRPMTEEEIIRKLGQEIPRHYPVLSHHWWDSSQLVYLGETAGRIPIYINRLVEEVDLIIGIGQIVPHRVSGFSGGGNIIQPGICGEETTGKTHWLSAQFEGWEILGRITNPVKKEIERVAEKVGLEWIINTIQDGTGRLVGVVAGDPVHAYREGASQSREVYQSQLPQEADIVIADSHPYDSELWLAAKGIYAAELAVKKGGVVILVTSCPEGISVSHPEVLEWGYQTFEEVDQKVRRGAIKKLTVAAHLVHVGRVIKERAKGVLVSPGISKEETERLGFIYAREPQEALDLAFSHLSRDAKVAVLQRGGEILPSVSPTSAASSSKTSP